MTMVIYYLPPYFQGGQRNLGCALRRSGVPYRVHDRLVDDLPRSPSSQSSETYVLAPFAILTGQSIQLMGTYRLQNYLAWLFTMLGYGTLSILRSSSTIAMGEGLQIVGSIGMGMLYVAPPVCYPCTAESKGQCSRISAKVVHEDVWTVGVRVLRFLLASSLIPILHINRTFGITIGTTILQNRLLHTLPADFLTQFPQGAEISYAAIPQIPSLPEPLQSNVKSAFAIAIASIWYTVVGLGALGLLTSLPMKGLKLHIVTDEDWGFEDKNKDGRASTDLEDGREKGGGGNSPDTSSAPRLGSDSVTLQGDGRPVVHPLKGEQNSST